MGSIMKFDYYYGVESEQFSFFRVPKLLIKDIRFKGLSSDAKILYGLMLDRMAISRKKGWFDEENRAYIHYRIENIMDDLGCSRPTCIKILAELDCKKGIGLIEKRRQGQGKPDIIYVKNFVLDEQGENYVDSESSKSELSEVKNCDSQKSIKFTAKSSKSERPEVKDVNANNINNNYTDFIYNKSINLSMQEQQYEKAENSTFSRCVEIIEENIEYEILKTEMRYNSSILDEIVALIAEIVYVERADIRIGGTPYPYQMVRNRMLEIRSEHVQYVLECMRKSSTKIANIRAYLLTALFNAPSTLNSYYQAEVNHDMYG